MASTARFMMERALSGSDQFNETGFNRSMIAVHQAQTNATSLLIKKLVFAESKSIRTSTIILGVFNVLAAFATASSILYDSYMGGKRCNPKFKTAKWCVRRIHPAEIFPLLLAIGIVFQGVVFIGVQSTGLTSLFTKGCSVIAQFMWPALFLVPYVQMVFGVECAIRALRPLPFQERGRYTVPILGVIILILEIGTWIPSQIFQQSDICFASLFWYIERYGTLGMVMLFTIAGIMLISAITIFIRLSSSNLIDEHQRIAASRMVYYLVLGIISLAFIIPWFVSLASGDGDLKTAMMAAVVVNLSGLMSGLLQLFLRSNTATSSFGPASSRDNRKHEIKIWGPNELIYSNHILSPLSAPRTLAELPSRSNSRADSNAALVREEKGRVMSMESLESLYDKKSPTSKFNEQAYPKTNESKDWEANAYAPSSPPRGFANKQAYSIFPAGDNNKLGVKTKMEPTSVYDISYLQPPVPSYGRGHKRDSSMQSTTTVQIGLRLSHAVVASVPLSLAPTVYQPNSGASRLAVPLPLKLQTQGSKLPSGPSPLVNSSSQSPKTTSPKLASPRTTAIVNKSLPPTPEPEPIILAANETLQLSPAVYSPEKKTGPSAKAEKPSKTASLSRGPLQGNPLDSPVKPAAKKSDWI